MENPNLTLDRGTVPTEGDDQATERLLQQFAESRDPQAFESIVRLHGPLVFGVCRRILGNHHDAEDVFQATFLLLAREAASIRHAEALAVWLHRVSYRAALRAKSKSATRRKREIPMLEVPEPSVVERKLWRDIEPILDQELNRLPAMYREPVLLCDVAGKTQREAAREIGCPEGTLASRLSRARAILAGRLTRQGVTLTSATLTLLLVQNSASAAVPAPLIASTLTAVSAVGAVQTATTGSTIAKAVSLFRSAIQSLTLGKLALAGTMGTAVLTVSLVTLAMQPAPGQKPAAGSKRDELATIVDSYRKQAAALKSLAVEYHTTASALSDPREILRYLRMPYLPDTRHRFVFKGEMRYSTISHANNGVYDDLTERTADGVPAKVNVAAGGEWAANGKAVYMLDGNKPWRNPPLGSIALPPGAGIDLPNKRTDQDGTHFDQTYLRELLRALPDVFGVDQLRYQSSLVGLGERSLLKLKAGREQIDGAECAVVEWLDERLVDPQDAAGGKLRFQHVIWCDPALSYAIRQHDLFLEGEKKLLRHVTFDDFTEVVSGAWYPRHIVADECASPGKPPKEAWGKPLIRYDMVVEDIHANDIPDELFTPEVPPGTWISDERYLKEGRPVSYIQPADRTQLDGVIKAALESQQTSPRAPAPAEELPTIPPESSKLPTILVANCVVLVGILVVVWIRRRR